MSDNLVSPWPSFSQEEADTVASVLLSNKVNYWTGDIGRKFEREFADFAETKFAIAVANGTVALDLIYHGLSIGSRNGGSEDDEVFVTSRTFLASVSSIMNAGAKPIFVDVDRDSQNIDPTLISQNITKNTKAILCVHLAGWPCDIDAIKKALGDRNIQIIEDCAQAHGARYKGKSVGSLGHAAAWSFCQDKIMTTGGEGGMVTCSDDMLWRKMWAYKDHGKSYAAVYEKGDHPPGFRWLHENLGTNWRLTEMQSAIGRIQLKRMKKWTQRRHENAQALFNALKPFANEDGLLRMPDFAFTTSNNDPDNYYQHAWYKFYIFIRVENLPIGWSRDRIVADLVELGIPCYQGSCSEVYLEKVFDNTKFRPEKRLSVAKELGETSIMLLVHPTIDQNEISIISKKLIEYFSVLIQDS